MNYVLKKVDTKKMNVISHIFTNVIYLVKIIVKYVYSCLGYFLCKTII